MFTAFLRAITQLTDPRIARLLGGCVLLSLGCFAAAWFGVGWLLTHSTLTGIGWIETALDVLGGLSAIALTWLAFPLVVSTFVAVFLERVAAAVEARHYPDLPKAPGLAWLPALCSSLRFLCLVVVLNAVLLLTLLVPPAYPVAYFAGNGLLLGREYFELVALRRLAPADARSLRRRHLPELLAMGVVTTALLTVPVLNLIVPVIATAAMVHRFEAWRPRAAARQTAGGG